MNRSGALIWGFELRVIPVTAVNALHTTGDTVMMLQRESDYACNPSRGRLKQVALTFGRPVSVAAFWQHKPRLQPQARAPSLECDALA